MQICPNLCSSLEVCLYNYQTLIAGTVAVLGAIASACIVYVAAKMPLKEKSKLNQELDNRRLKYLKHTLSQDFRLLSARAQQASDIMRNARLRTH